MTAAPRLAAGTELLGEFQDSGYRDAPQLVRRADGQVLQLSRLAYLVAAAADGERDPAQIAALVSQQHSRPLGPDGVAYLVESKLAPAGVVTCGDVVQPAPRARPLLSLRARLTLLPPRASSVAGTALRPLFRLPAVVAVLIGVAAVDYWLVVEHGLRDALRQVVGTPSLLLWVVGLTLLSAVFHELGHAAGCRRGGARPGAIGFGLYLVWPSFFTDVTDTYRLGRRGRLRADLGGIYFNAVFVVAVAGAYAVTGREVLLLVIVISHWEVLEQLLPFVRFDGYFILSDIVGVPDLFARTGPILRSVTRRGRADPRVRGLRRSVRVVVTCWVACVVPLLALNIGYLLLHLPLVERTLLRSAYGAGRRAVTDLVASHYAAASAEAIGALLVTLPAVGALYLVVGLTRRTALGYLRRQHRPWQHALALALLLVPVLVVGSSWAQQLPR